MYQGPKIDIWSTHVDLMRREGHLAAYHHESGANFVVGSVWAVCACLFVALCTIVQAKMSARYPCHYSSAALIALMGAIQAAVFALCSERDWNQWKLAWNIRLLSVAYSGIVVSGLMVVVVMWCVHLKGPLFVSIFGPFALVLMAIVGSLCLNEQLHLGRCGAPDS